VAKPVFPEEKKCRFRLAYVRSDRMRDRKLQEVVLGNGKVTNILVR
jgi:hypothetical protein